MLACHFWKIDLPRRNNGAWGSVGVADKCLKKATKVSLSVTGEEVEKRALSGEHVLSRGSWRGCVC